MGIQAGYPADVSLIECCFNRWSVSPIHNPSMHSFNYNARLRTKVLVSFPAMFCNRLADWVWLPCKAGVSDRMEAWMVQPPLLRSWVATDVLR